MDFKLEIGEFGKIVIDFIKTEFRDFLRGFSSITEDFLELFADGILFLPIWVFILVFALLAWWFANRNVAILSVIGFLFIWNMDLWEATADTLALVSTAAMITLIIGFPLGLLSARYNWLRDVLSPILDVMQTLPSFVYLLPVVMFFGLGTTAGLAATLIFSLAPVVRFTDIGIRQVDEEITEAALSYGSTPWQMLYEIQIPMAKETIMGGINQTIMLNLSMTVIGGMIGGGGLGLEVVRSVQRVDIPAGIESGISVVFVAVILDRLLQSMGEPASKRQSSNVKS